MRIKKIIYQDISILHSACSQQISAQKKRRRPLFWVYALFSYWSQERKLQLSQAQKSPCQEKNRKFFVFRALSGLESDTEELPLYYGWNQWLEVMIPAFVIFRGAFRLPSRRCLVLLIFPLNLSQRFRCRSTRTITLNLLHSFIHEQAYFSENFFLKNARTNDDEWHFSMMFLLLMRCSLSFWIFSEAAL